MSESGRINRNIKILLITAAAIIVIDQITKAAVSSRLIVNQSVAVAPGLLNLVNWRNTGAAFSILRNGGWVKSAFLIATTVVALAVIWTFLKKTRIPLMAFALSLVAGGAIGNLIDRLRFGYVVDFLDFYIASYHWPAFNVADSAITCGVVIAAVVYYMKGDG